MKKICFVFAALLCSSSALAQSLPEKTGINSVLGVAPATADFVREVAVSDQFEIQSSQLAQQEHLTSVQEFSSRMIADHQATSGQLKEMVHSGDLQVDLPTTLDSSHQDMLDRLRKLHGSSFEERYRAQQISAHESAVSLFQRYADNGDNMKLKAWAAKTLPTLKSHLEMARRLPQ
ncbi:hypothetical protein CFR73_02530 [Novacetimonas maltaceti]|uniref:DUF4142 domain-containing protein n=1 Tax=Novacetimonas maltaceti TaxID=1203393 RepID=A0A2S3W625_9PROT|nr:DUF4142 domain-containing protein [Novacetimonas maltaceti]POF64325.1 hypothetical protein KMAL_02200 [Novacetimonas maltaceti]PYD61422.1 hypothetical protein CFR73_02530 [Novacetimonas maltaceti]